MGGAVNQAVVIELLVVFAFNVVFTQMLLATHPDLNSGIQMSSGWRGLQERVPGPSDAGSLVRFSGLYVIRDVWSLRRGSSDTWAKHYGRRGS